MPGIAGLITKAPREWAERELRQMLATLRHECFYSDGTWVDEDLGVYVGWVARKNSFSEEMPLFNERGDVCLVFSGEEFPESGTIRRLREEGHAVESEGPSYLVHLAEQDPAFPAGLNGRFQGLLADRRRGTATLFDDRYGMQRLYYHESKEAFYFAAEAKAMLAVRSELRSADLQSLGELVSCGCVLEDRTVFAGIRALPAASAWVFRNGAIERRGVYFKPREWEEQAPVDAEHYYHELRDVLSRNLPRYLHGRERVGIALTGGLDTRIIMAWNKPAPGSLPCYTFGGMFRGCQDVLLARQIANTCKQSHEVIQVGQEFLSRFPHYAERSVYLAEGGVDVSRSSDLYVSERVREITPAKVVGTYGSEILRHAVMFKPARAVAKAFRSEFVPYIRRAGDTYTRVCSGHPITFAAFRQSPWYHYGVLALEQSQLTVRSPYLDNDFVRTVFRARQLGSPGEDVRLRLIQEGSPMLGRIRTDRGVGGDSGRISSAASRGILEFSLKAEYAYDYGMPQWLARVDRLLSPLRLERLFLGRHKLLHYRVWYRDVLAGHVRDILLDPRTLSRPYLERRRLEEIVHDHTEGKRNHTLEIHRLLTLELLHRQFFDSQ